MAEKQEEKPLADFQVKMNAAADAAEDELKTTLAGMSTAERKGAQAVIDWWKSHYMQAGHKRLGKVVKTL